MAVYLVTWDLNKEKPAYTQARAAFIARVEMFESVKDQGLDSVRFVSTGLSADEVYQFLRMNIDDNDRLLVVRFGDHQGWLSQKTWNWINARV